MLKCIIIDSNKSSRQVTEKHVKQFRHFDLAKSCSTLKEASMLFAKDDIDILFIDLPVTPSKADAAALKKLQGKTEIIVTSADKKVAKDAFDLEAAYFLEKPVSFMHFLKAISKALQIDALNILSDLADNESVMFFPMHKKAGKAGKEEEEDAATVANDIPIAMKRSNDYQVNILIADDDEEDIVMFQKALQRTGVNFCITIAQDGEEVTEILSNRKGHLPDLIFLDVKMPRKDGTECLEEIRQQARFQNIPVIMYTNSTDQRLIDAMYEGGANIYLPKPYSFQEQVRLLEKVFSVDWHEYYPKPTKEKFLLN